MTHDPKKFQHILQQFMNEHGDSFSSQEEAIEYFINEYNASLNSDAPLPYGENDPILQSLDLFNEAMQTRKQSKVKVLMDQALELWPNNWHVHIYRLIEPDSNDLEELVVNYEQLERKAYKETWKKQDQREAIEVEAYLNIKRHFSDILFACGQLDKAQKHFEELLRMDEFDSSGARYKLLAIYARKYDWKNAWKFYLKNEEAESDDQMVLPIIILAVLTDRITLAKKLFRKLMELNSDVSYLFEDEDEWPYSDIVDSADILQGRFAPFSYDSLLISLYDHLPLLYDNVFLYQVLEKEFHTLKSELGARSESHSLFLEQMSEIDYNPYSMDESMHPNLFSMYSEDESNPLRNIAIEQVRLLIRNNLQTYDDFLKKTEKQVKAIKGIGPVTIKKLKENGITFKDS